MNSHQSMFFSTKSSNRTETKSVATIVSLSLGSALLIAGIGSPAVAAAGCPAGATLVSGVTCEIVFTSTPSEQWTPPAGSSSLVALLVGAGGYGYAMYGAGGGDVKVVELSSSGSVEISVGLGGSILARPAETRSSVVTQGSETTTALGGSAPASGVNPIGGTSGSGLAASGPAGSGAGEPSVSVDGGAGLVVSDIPEAAGTLFASDDTCYGGGGASNYAGVGTASCGGGYTTDTSALTGVSPRANSGGGGSSWYLGNDFATQSGADGRVAIRFNMPELPDTGQSDSTPTALVAGGLLVLGFSAVWSRLRRRNA